MNPAGEVLDRVSVRYPRNPFYTVNYVQSVRETGADTILFTSQSEDKNIEYCLGHIFHGRLANSMVIDSLTEISHDEAFWRTIDRFIGRQRIYYAYFGSYASPGGIRIAKIDKTLEEAKRTEYVIGLQTNDLWQQVSKHHKRQIKKARRAGVTIEHSRKVTDMAETMQNPEDNQALCRMHKMLIDTSMERRKEANKSYVNDVDNSLCLPFLENGAGTISRAVLEGEVIASSLILESKEGGYYHSSGNSETAAKTGASHLLIFTVMEDLKNHGQKVFNLGGGNNEMEGLDRFKMGFGASQVSLTSAEVRRVPAAMRVVSKLAAWIR